MDVIQLHAAAASLEPDYRDRGLRFVGGSDPGLDLHIRGAPVLRLALAGRFRGLYPLQEAPEGEGGRFVDYLHQRLAGFQLATIDHPWPDRVVVLRFQRRRLTGQVEERPLVGELLGKRCNAALLTEDGRVDRPLYRPDITDPDPRFLPGMAYQPPEPPPGAGEPDWNLLDGPPPPDLDVSGEGRTLARRIVPVPPRLADALSPLEEGERRDLLHHAAATLTTATDNWHLHRPAKGEPFLYPLALPGYTTEPAGPLTQAWPAHMETAIRRGHLERQHQRQSSRLRALRKRLEDRLAKVAADEERHAQPGEYRRLGQALTSLGGGIARSDTVRATDYFANPPAAIDVPVRPGHSVQEEAERYFNKARKADRGQAQAAQRRRETEADLAELARLENDLADADAATLEAIGDRLDRLEAIPAEKRHAQRGKEGSEGAAAPMEYHYGGHTILVGTSRSANDWLTFRQAQPWDIWLHLQGLPGAHVVIRRERKDPLPAEDVLDYAARLAVTHSPKADRKAEVDWTEVKYVRRHPDGRPGQAIYTHYKTQSAHALTEAEDGP